MRLIRIGLKGVFLGLFLAIVSASTFADPVGVSYSVSGSPGAWVLDFSFTNSVPGQTLYFFGVFLPTQDVLSSPTGWVNCWTAGCVSTTLNPTNLGGGIGTTAASITYDDLWRFPGVSGGIASSSTLGGFEAGVNSMTAPTSVEWFAFTADLTGNSPYTGGQNFSYTGDCTVAFGVSCAEQSEFNPLFAGSALPTPEPNSLMMIAAGFSLIISRACKHRGLRGLTSEYKCST